MALETANPLKQARLEVGWTKRELARRSGVSAQVIYLIESGKIANPRTDTALKLAEALGRPVEALFALDGSSAEGETSAGAAVVSASGRASVVSIPDERNGAGGGVAK